MFGDRKTREAGRKTFLDSVKGLATTIAVVATFFGVPVVYNRSVGFVQAFTANQYGSGWEDATAFCWFVICIFLVFFASRASIATALVMGGLAICDPHLLKNSGDQKGLLS